MEIGLKAKDQLEAWAAVERERLDDMMAEARSNIAREEAAAKTAHHGKPGSKRASRVVQFEDERSESIV
jgi:hypothetical protein